MYSIYLLHSPSLKRTYIGMTTDPTRRLRQHRGEIAGGALSTSRAKDWELIVVISGFLTRSSACRWEKICKLRAKGVDRRSSVMLGLLRGECPTDGKYYPVPKGLCGTTYSGWNNIAGGVIDE